jgi:DNA adenine methylase
VGRIKRFYNTLNCYKSVTYIEPFFGAGAVGLQLFRSCPVKNILINDIDIGIAAFWNTIIHYPDELCKSIESFTPSVEGFYDIKKYLTNEEYIKLFKEPIDKLDKQACVNWAFSKLAIHQMSYSGLGTQAGGPIGGKEQKSNYNVACRWSPKYIVKNIRKYHKFLADKNITKNRCLSQTVSQIIGKHDICFYYLDPPYYEKGEELYQYAFTSKQHIALCKKLEKEINPWLLSYDDVKEIRDMYSWARFREIPMTYTINGAVSKVELLITAPKYSYLLETLEEDVIDFAEI